mgnify:CR=1 FL=1
MVRPGGGCVGVRVNWGRGVGVALEYMFLKRCYLRFESHETSEITSVLPKGRINGKQVSRDVEWREPLRFE